MLPMPPENPMLQTPINVPPEGHPLGGVKKVIINTQERIWEMHHLDGHDYIVLNEFALKEVLARNGIIIENGIIQYDEVNKVISFNIQDLKGSLSIEQLKYIEDVLKYFAIKMVIVEPEKSRVTVFINQNFNLGGIPKK